MRNLNNKGMTSLELLASFVIVVAIVAGLFDVILNYKNKEQIEALRNSVISYSNNLQKIVQDDFIKGHLEEVSIAGTSKSATFKMSAAGGYQTTMELDTANGVISYGKTNQVMRYVIPEIPDLTLDASSKIEWLGGTVDYLKITFRFLHPNFGDEGFVFSITSPINYR